MAELHSAIFKPLFCALKLNGIKTSVMTDYHKFVHALEVYLSLYEKAKDNKEERKRINEDFILSIKDLKCNDFRFFYFMARYKNGKGQLDEARTYIDKSIECLTSIKELAFTEENSQMVFAPRGNGAYIPLSLPHIHLQLADIYTCAGEVYGKLNIPNQSLKYYKRSHYYQSFLKTEFDNLDKISLFSFRRFNEYSLTDLINNTITVSPSTKMNDPFDSLINIWASEGMLRKTCHTPGSKHIEPFSKSFSFFRIRSFCGGRGNTPVWNHLMWSHYAGEHTGFCVKYKLSQHFIKQEENDTYEHMYLKKIKYGNNKIDLHTGTIDTNLAFATKNKCWKYENEVRLIAYNPNKAENFYGIPLDEKSGIEAIFFGYKCPEQNIATIKNLFAQNANIHKPQFYQMALNSHNIYRLNYHKI